MPATTPDSLTSVHPTTTKAPFLGVASSIQTTQNGEERYNRPLQLKLEPKLNPPTAKSRTIAVRLMSMALTGFFMTFRRPRTHRPLSMLKYDPVGE
jgi:hypothetical protein